MSAFAALLLAAGDGLYLPLDAELEPDPQATSASARASIGLHLGWVDLRDADEGAPVFGVHVRVHLHALFAVEGSIDLAEADFADGDAELRQTSLSASVLFFPLGHTAARPYLAAGAGWVRQEFDFSGLLAPLDQDTDNLAGFHAGAGLEGDVASGVTLFLDFRYAALGEPDLKGNALDGDEFDSWCVTFGVSLHR
jgi:opacity protein-like surface antigen